MISDGPEASGWSWVSIRTGKKPYGFMFEMVYLRYTNVATYTQALFRRPKINSFGSPLELCIPEPNLIFQTSRTTLEQVLLSKFIKLWSLTSKMSKRGNRNRHFEI